MKLSNYIACICEGAAEQAIMELLLDNKKLIFDYSNLLEGEVLRCRSAQSFENRCLRKGFTEKITVVRILDSHRERFKLSKAYLHKIDVINIVTAPEIEMLVILSKNKYKAYRKARKMPSDYCKNDLKISNVKSYSFIKSYFKDVTTLISAIKEYKRISNVQPGEYTLADLLKE